MESFSSKPRWIRAFQVFQFCFGMLLWLPVFYELQKRAGLSETEIFGIQTYYYLAFCFLELPTGLIADRLGYRFSMGLGGATGVIANLLPVLFPSYLGFLGQFLLVAVSRSFVSGAASAYLYERLAIDQAHAIYQSVEGSSRALGLLGKVVGWSIVGFWIDEWPAAAFLASACFLLVSTFSVLYLPSLPEKEALKTETFEPSWSRAWKSMEGEPQFLWLMAQGVGLFVVGRVIQVNLYQPILKAHQVPVAAFGLGMSLMTIAEALGSGYPEKVPATLRGRHRVETVTRLTLVCAGCMPFFAVFPERFQAAGAALAFGVLLLFAWATGAGYPLQKRVLNDAIPDPRLRASFLSLESILDRGVNALIVAALGTWFTGGERELTLTLSVLGLFFFLASLGVQRGWSRSASQKV